MKSTHGIGSSRGLVRDHTANRSPENAARESIVQGTVLWVGKGPLSHEVFEFKFISI